MHVGKALVVWLVLTAATVVIISCISDQPVRRRKQMLEFTGPDTPLWLRLSLLACLALVLTHLRRIVRMPRLRSVLTALGTYLLLFLASYYLEHLDWRLLVCGFWALVVAAFTERHLRIRYRIRPREPSTPG